MPPEFTPETWAQIRYAYEHTGRPVADICAEHGISDGTLRDRVRRWRWTRRRPPIAREGPPAMVVPRREISQRDFAEPSPWPLGPRLRGDERGEPAQQTDVPALTPTRALPLSAGGSGEALPLEAEASSGTVDDAAIVPRLQSAVARVLPAIEATIARLAGEPMPPREMEQAARALGALMRTLRELNTLLSQRQAAAPAAFDDDMPEDIDEFRRELARRIDAFVASDEAEIPMRYEAAWHDLAAGATEGAPPEST